MAFTAILLYNGPASLVSDPCFVRSLKDDLAMLTTSIKLCKLARAASLSKEELTLNDDAVTAVNDKV